jgi:hypothetical protein
MAYLGRQPVLGNFVKLDAITVVNGQAAYTMQNNSVNFTDYSTVNQFLVSLNGVIQAPTSSFTVSGSTLTFASNLSTGDVIDFIIVFGNSLSAGTVSDSAITTAKLASTSVTAAKLNNDIISGTTALTSEPADTDEFLVSDAGTLKRIDYSLIKGGGITEADQWRITANITADTNVVSANLERSDSTAWGKIGTGMSQSSGYFSFPSTGIWKVSFTLTGYPNTNDDIIGQILATTNNSSYSNVAQVIISRDGNGINSATTSTFIDCTDTAQVKVNFKIVDVSSGSTIHGDTSQNKTFFEFIRLGDT